MEQFKAKQQVEAHYTQLEGMGAFIDDAIDEQVGIYLDEQKRWLECLIYGNGHYNILDCSARLNQAKANLEWLAWQKIRDNKKTDLQKSVK